MLNEKVTIKHLMYSHIFLAIGFIILSELSNHEMIDTETLFTGAVLGVAVSLFMSMQIVLMRKIKEMNNIKSSSKGEL